jgi:hypothetical protein
LSWSGFSQFFYRPLNCDLTKLKLIQHEHVKYGNWFQHMVPSNMIRCLTTCNDYIPVIRTTRRLSNFQNRECQHCIPILPYISLNKIIIMCHINDKPYQLNVFYKIFNSSIFKNWWWICYLEKISFYLRTQPEVDCQRQTVGLLWLADGCVTGCNKYWERCYTQDGGPRLYLPINVSVHILANPVPTSSVV